MSNKILIGLHIVHIDIKPIKDITILSNKFDQLPTLFTIHK